MSLEQFQVSFTFLPKAEYRNDCERIVKDIEKLENATVENKIELIKALGDMFVIAQVPHRDISARLTETIGHEGLGVVADSWIRKVCHKNGWTRPYGINEIIDNAKSLQRSDSDSSDSLNTIFSWEARLDAEKQIAKERKTDPELVTLEKIIPDYKYRYPYYKFLKDTIEIFRKFLEEIQKDFDEETDDDGKKFRRYRNYRQLYESEQDMLEYHKALMDLYYNCLPSAAKAVDNRQYILPYMYFPILAKLAITTIKHFASKHFALVRAVYNITTKKTTQFTKSIDSAADLLASTMDDAWRWHYIDIKCPDCRTQSLKPRMDVDGTWQFVCKNWQFHGRAHGMEEVTFAPSLFSHRVNALTLNIGRASQKYLKDRGMAAPEDLRDN